MSYYWFNRRELSRKARDRYRNRGVKEKAAKYYRSNIEVLRKNARNRYKTCQKKKEAKREYQRQRYHMNSEKLKQYQRDYYDSKRIRK